MSDVLLGDSKGRLDEYAVNLVARLGGLVVLRDLARDSNWRRWKRKKLSGKCARLLLEQGLAHGGGNQPAGQGARLRRAAAGNAGQPQILLRAELRLLLALGHQIGMAVENSYLIQQTARRSEELHILNEIGRALSSTLDLDALFERIYSEMRRLLDVEQLLHRLSTIRKPTQVRFEIEVVDGERLPKRTRPAGNHLVEYVIRTRQPLLIRDQFAEEVQRAGLRAARDMRFALRGAADPVRPRHRRDGGAQPEGTRVRRRPRGTAARAGQRSRSRDRKCAAFPRRAEEIAAFDADQQRFAPRDHHAQSRRDAGRRSPRKSKTRWPTITSASPFWIIPSKELVIQAEAGARRDALGRRIPLGEGLVGQVARTGQMAVGARSECHVAASGACRASVSAIALPVIYAEQLLGVLYVESSEPCDFSEEEVLLLRTLADLVRRRAAQCADVPEGAGTGHHRRPDGRENPSLPDGSAFGGMEALDAREPPVCAGADGPGPLQIRERFLRTPGRRRGAAARRAHSGTELPALGCGGALWRRRIRDSDAGNSVEQARQLASKLRGWVAADPLLRDKNITASFGIAGFPVHGSTPQELIQVADSSMYLSKHQGGNAVSTAEQGDPNDRKRWKKDVLEAYLGVTLKRLFSTGPEAFEEIYRRLEQFTRSLSETRRVRQCGRSKLPPAVVETVTSLALAIDAKDHYTQGHSQKVSAYAVMIAQALGMNRREVEEIRLAALAARHRQSGNSRSDFEQDRARSMPTEWETMKTHTDLGAKILEPLAADEPHPAMVRHHHEFYDGSGYPAIGWRANRFRMARA